jgi:hypothetical protein
MTAHIFSKEEFNFLVITIYVISIGMINLVLIKLLTKINSGYYYIFGLPNLIIVIFLTIYYYRGYLEFRELH